MNMLGIRPGSWSLTSIKNNKWNTSGRTDGWACSGGMCPEAEKELKRLKKKYGKPPKDLEYFFMKD